MLGFWRWSTVGVAVWEKRQSLSTRTAEISSPVGLGGGGGGGHRGEERPWLSLLVDTECEGARWVLGRK